jgi:predicted phosphodiesterase
MKKWEEAVDIMSKKEVSYFINGGDLFDICSPDLDVIYDIIHRWNPKIKWLQTVGNHDIDGRSRDLKGTALGLLEKSGVIEIPEKNYIIDDEIVGINEKSVYIRFAHYYDRQDGDKRFEVKDGGKDTYNILILHDSFTTEKVKFKHTMVKDIGDTNFDLVLCGHYHYPFEEKHGKTNYINLGSFTRLTKSMRDMARDIQLLIISPFEKQKLEFIKLKSVVKFQEAFDLEKVEQDIEEETKLSSEFTEGVNKLKSVGVNLEEEMISIAEEFKVKKGIVDVCKDYLSRARRG